MIGRKFKAKEKLKILNEWWNLGRGTKNKQKVARQNNCSVHSIYLWNKQYDGTVESLENKDQTPHRIWNAYSEEDLNEFKEAYNEHAGIGRMELYGLLQIEKGFTKSIRTMYRMMNKLNIAPLHVIEKYIPKNYETPKMIGVKWQVDVKYVPYECLENELRDKYMECGNSKGLRFYQYTCIDECSRKRFMYMYDSFGKVETIDFMKRCIVFFGYMPLIVQTDNGSEFTNAARQKLHAFTIFLNGLGIKHQLTRVCCPRHNGKVERSHRTDNEEFYSRNMFVNLADAREKLKGWIYRYNNVRVMTSLNYKTPQSVEDKLIEYLKQNNAAEYIGKDGEVLKGKVKFVKRNEDWAFAERSVLTQVS